MGKKTKTKEAMTAQVNVRVPLSIFAKLENAAKITGYDRTRLIIRLLERELDRNVDEIVAEIRQRWTQARGLNSKSPPGPLGPGTTGKSS